MKRLEVTYDGKRVTLARESEEHLTAEQKYTVMLTLIGCTAFLGFIYLLFVCAL